MTEILYIIDSLWGVGGGELALARLARLLPTDQYRCRVVTFAGSKEGFALFEGHGIPVHVLPIRNVYGLAALRAARQIRRLVKEERIDIVHTFFPVSDLWAGPIAKWSGAPVLISSRRDMGIIRRRWHHLAYRLLSSTYDQVQAVSESVRQYSIESDGIEAKRVITCHNGVPDLSQFIDPQQVERLKREASIEPGRAIVTCVANFRHVKGIDVFVRAAAIVAAQRPHVQFLVAGEFGKNPADAAFTSSVLALATQLGLDSRLKFLGAVQSIPSLLSFSDVFALPSRNEGLSNALLEAMQAGLPTVVTAVGGNTEVVSDGVSGFVVPPEDPETFALRLLDLLDNPHLRSAMGAASADLAAREFSLDAVLRKVVQSYESLSKKCIAAKAERPKAALVASIALGLQDLPIQEWLTGFGLGC